VAAEWAYRENLNRQHTYLVERKAQVIEDRKRRIEEAAKKERDRVERVAQKRLEALLQEVRQWKLALEVRAYVQARLASPVATEDLQDWANWALNEAEHLDPLKQGSRSKT